MLLRSLCVVLLALSTVSALNCECSGYFEKTEASQDTMTWLNTIALTWYETQFSTISALVQDLVNKEVNHHIPDWIADLKITKIGSGHLPTLEHMRSRVNTIKCDEGVLTRTIMDLKVVYHSADPVVIADLDTVLGHIFVSVDGVYVLAVARVEILMNSALGLPGMQSGSVSFIGRPKVEFGVKLLGLHTDSFGLHGIIKNAVENVIQEMLVYPGMFYLNLAPMSSGGGMKTQMVSNDRALWPAIMSAKFTITPSAASKNKGFFMYLTYKTSDGEDRIEGAVLFVTSDKATQSFKISAGLRSFEYPRVQLLVLTGRRDVYVTKADVDVQYLLKSDYVSEKHVSTYSYEGQDWNVELELSAYLLPRIPITQSGTAVNTIDNLFQIAQCKNVRDRGVLYVHIHRATGLPEQDDLVGVGNPYVKIFINNVHKVDTDYIDSLNPVYNVNGEFIIGARADDSDCKTSAAGHEYRGKHQTTRSGKTCQNWTSNSPHLHKFSNPKYKKESGVGDHNYCRNPDNEPTPWCFTTDSGTRWEPCAVPDCEDIPLEDQTIRFEIYDFDDTSSDEFMGEASMQLTRYETINQPLSLRTKGGNKPSEGTLYVSLVFRAVPFL